MGPRSAHIAGLPYVSFAPPEDLAGELNDSVFAPGPQDPADYGRPVPTPGRPAFRPDRDVRGRGPRAGCPRHLRLRPAGGRAPGFAALGKVLGCSAVDAATLVLGRATDQVAAAVRALVAEYRLDRKQLSWWAGAAGPLCWGRRWPSGWGPAGRWPSTPR